MPGRSLKGERQVHSMKDKKIIEISNALVDIEILTERVYVLSDDLDQGYFGERIESEGDYWKIAPPYYNHSQVKMNMILDMANEIQKKLRAIQDSL